MFIYLKTKHYSKQKTEMFFKDFIDMDTMDLCLLLSFYYFLKDVWKVS